MRAGVQLVDKRPDQAAPENLHMRAACCTRLCCAGVQEQEVSSQNISGQVYNIEEGTKSMQSLFLQRMQCLPLNSKLEVRRASCSCQVCTGLVTYKSFLSASNLAAVLMCMASNMKQLAWWLYIMQQESIQSPCAGCVSYQYSF